MKTEKHEMRKMISEAKSDHKKNLKEFSALFSHQRDEFLEALVQSKTPNWGGLKISQWR